MLNTTASSFPESAETPLQHSGSAPHWDASTAHPLVLRIANGNLSPDAQWQMYNDIISYFVRRAICGLPGKNYKRFFYSILKT